MMAHNTAQMLPPKMAEQFAQRARNGEGVRLTPTSDIYEFPQGNTVICMIHIGSDPMGHVIKDPVRAEQLRTAIALAKAEAAE